LSGGQQPTIAPGQTFEYSSFCPITTAWGTMEGSHSVETSDGKTAEIPIARFFLVSPEGEEPLRGR